jgi:hypothetical protein
MDDRGLQMTIALRSDSASVRINHSRLGKRLTAGLKLNSITSPTRDVRLFWVYARASFTLTITLVLRNPPTGRPFGGDVLVDAVFAAVLKASIVLPVVGLNPQSVLFRDGN